MAVAKIGLEMHTVMVWIESCCLDVLLSPGMNQIDYFNIYCSPERDSYRVTTQTERSFYTESSMASILLTLRMWTIYIMYPLKTTGRLQSRKCVTWLRSKSRQNCHTAATFQSTRNQSSSVCKLSTAPKNSRGIRLIHDMSRPEGSALNNFAVKQPFQAESVKDAISRIGLTPPVWFSEEPLCIPYLDTSSEAHDDTEGVWCNYGVPGWLPRGGKHVRWMSFSVR